ncbi:MAG TPA: L,D-transpeptidase family protein [Candidatus Acidoferrales bacterium]|nr:L,D-transpeptidase family protein [Candidatus Acidoferrales bacterium]
MNSKLRRFCSCLTLAFVLIGLCAGSTAASSQGKKKTAASPATSLAQQRALIRAIVASGRLEEMRWPSFAEYRGPANDLYQSGQFAPLWVRNGDLTMQAGEMVAILAHADVDGLDPEDYDGPRWEKRLVMLQSQHAPADEARFDVALSVCAMRYVSDIHGGRTPRAARAPLEVVPEPMNVSRFVRMNLANSLDLRVDISSIEPPLVGYKRLRAALKRYTEMAAKDDGSELPPVKEGILFENSTYEGVPRLAQLLHIFGDLPENIEVPAGSQKYTADLVAAVKHFQIRHGLRADGYIDPDTLSELNVPLKARIEQMRLALERFRWFRFQRSEPILVINVPGFRLYALDERGEVALSMTVDVGQDFKRTRTPVLESTIDSLIFRPYWEVPFDIQRNEIAPEIKDDPEYMIKYHFDAVGRDGKAFSGVVRGPMLEEIRSGALHLRQRPGPDNSLGLLKFNFPNRYSVYLHDVPNWEDYFSEYERSISHGCVHVQHPAALAAWILRDSPVWSYEKVQNAMKNGPDANRVVPPRPMPVMIVYMTAVVQENGDLYFYPDIYGYDAELEAALEKLTVHP